MLQETFITLASQYTHQPETYWAEISKNYTGKGRHYHTLEHLQHLLQELQNIRPHIHDWNALLFTLYYHDVVYNARKADNEEKSAELAGKRLTAMTVPEPIITRCKALIMATKRHLADPDTDTNYFTDADLSILGQPWDVYNQYAKNVRKEYRIYPDVVYKPGRKKVLQYFLDMDRIYKTDTFFDKYETAAKQNLRRELDLL